MGTLYFTRHGETVWNVANKICGSTDVKLTERGIKQARDLGKKIREEKIAIDYILTSPLIRARETARIISEETGIPMRIEEGLREQNFGRYEGTPRDGKEFAKDKLNFIHSYGGGESMLRMAQRIYTVLDEVSKDVDHIYLIVAHNGIARFVESYYSDMENEEFTNFRIHNCQLLKYEKTL